LDAENADRLAVLQRRCRILKAAADALEQAASRLSVVEGALREIDAMPRYPTVAPEYVESLRKRYERALDIVSQALTASLDVRSSRDHARTTGSALELADLRSLLRLARDYVVDALEAHEHSDGRELLGWIDAALSSAKPDLGDSSRDEIDPAPARTKTQHADGEG
jgi:hypothetical protein